MARVTVEDCPVENRFELVTIASYRAKEINKGSPILVERDNDKNAVIALREIAAAKLDPAKLSEQYLQTLRKNYNPDILVEENKNKEVVEAHSEETSTEFEIADDAISIENYMFEDEVEAED